MAGIFTTTNAPDFNPLPRKEGDGQTVAEVSKTNAISIHSLVKRETVFCSKHCCAAIANFNPLPRKEGDGYNPVYHIAFIAISIHSLVKRETAFFPV